MNRQDEPADFTNLVSDYIRYRPDYPAGVFDLLETEGFLREGVQVADIGAGTGLFTLPLLKRGARVVAVEPNDAMRHAADELLGDRPGYQSVSGRGEATGLADESVDLITIAQALHWLAPDEARAEFRRITRPPHRLTVTWNLRDRHANPVTAGYEEIIETWGLHGESVNVDSPEVDGLVREVFGGPRFQRHTFRHTQTLDWTGLEGRMASSSYAPKPGHPDHKKTFRALRAVFDENETGGTVEFVYETRLYLGTISSTDERTS